jgi:hypothetical protein
MTSQEFDRKVQLAELMWAGFYYCPTTGCIIEAMSGDDKVLCSCGRSNPAVPTERTERSGTHIVRFLRKATSHAYVIQRAARRGELAD